MRCGKILQSSLACLACSGLLWPSALLRAEPPAAAAPVAPRTIDVALQPGNFLTGRVVDAAGQPVAHLSLALSRQQQVAAEAMSGAQGEFRLGPLTGGAYLLLAGNHPFPVRAWAGDTAPPSALHQALLVVGDVERGQGCTTDSCTTPGARGGLLSVLMNPFVIGAAIAAAIAIPLALDDDDAS